MKQLDNTFVDSTLLALASEAMVLLRTEAFRDLACEFGYAIALGRTPEQAIQADLASAVEQVEATRLVGDAQCLIRHFQDNSGGIRSVIECRQATDGLGDILAEFVVSGHGNLNWLMLEQISGTQ